MTFHSKNEATVLNGIMVPSSFITYVVQTSPHLATALQVGDFTVEQGDDLVICVMSSFCGHFSDYDLQQLNTCTRPQKTVLFSAPTISKPMRKVELVKGGTRNRRM